MDKNESARVFMLFEEACRLDESERAAYLGVLLNAKGELPGAEQHSREALDMRSKLLGEDHWRTATTRSELALILAKTDRAEEAEALFVLAYENFAGSLGPDHARTINAAKRLVNFYESQGDEEKAAK